MLKRAFTALGSELCVKATSTIIFATAAAIYCFIAYTSPGYDDEFYNIDKIEKAQNIFILLDHVNREDVHPSGQYVINYGLYKTLGSWPLVRVSGALLNFAALLLFVHSAALKSFEDRALSIMLIILSPTLLLWGTGVRWFAYYTPIFIALMLWIRQTEACAARFWLVFSGLLVVLFHINYVTLLWAGPLLLLAYVKRKPELRKEWTTALAALAAGAALCVPQAYYLVCFQLQNKDSQVGGFAKSFAFAAQGLLVNAGVFPLSALGILSVVLVLAVLAMIIRERGIRMALDPELCFLALSMGLIILSGLGVKARNVAPLTPLFNLTLIVLASRLEAARAARIGLACLGMINIVGVVDVALHRDTSKGSWNLPIAETMAIVEKEKEICGRRPFVVAVNEAVLTHALRGSSDNIVVGPYAPEPPEGQAVEAKPGDCFIALLTFRGSITKNSFQRMLKALPGVPKEEIAIGKDAYAEIKRRFDDDVPDYYVRILKFWPLSQRLDLSDWSAKQALYSGY